MKAITICQPFAHLIWLPETDPRHKRIENRSWPTNYRGELAIHAGKSLAYLDLEGDEADPLSDVDVEFSIPVAEMQFGAVVALARLVDCLRVDDIHAGKHDATYPWAKDHQHAEGPWCWVLADVRPLPAPIPFRGAQGLWNFPDELLQPVAA